jgi:hypothetical protein
VPKGILEFNLPEEEQEFKDAQEGPHIKYRLQDFDNWLRGIVKHGDEKAQNLKAEDVRDKLYEMMEGTNWRD